MASLLLVAAAPTPSPTLDQDFLLLPAFDVERITDAGSRAEPVVGDELHLRVQNFTTADASIKPETLTVQVPEGTEDLTQQGWEIEPAPRPEKTGDSAPAEAGIDFIATPLKPGNLTLPSLAIATADGKKVARTNPFRLNVASAIRPDDKKPQESEPPAPPSRIAFPWWFVTILVILALAFVVAAAWAIVRMIRGRRRVVEKPVEPPKPEDELALAALAELERKRQWASGQFKPHYFAVSEIVKQYLGARYGFPAAESTTAELLQELERNSWLPAGQVDKLESLFSRLDRVKFTDHVPEDGEGLQLLETARQLVFLTRKVQITATPVSGNGPALTTGGPRAS